MTAVALLIPFISFWGRLEVSHLFLSPVLPFLVFPALGGLASRLSASSVVEQPQEVFQARIVSPQNVALKQVEQEGACAYARAASSDSCPVGSNEPIQETRSLSRLSRRSPSGNASHSSDGATAISSEDDATEAGVEDHSDDEGGSDLSRESFKRVPAKRKGVDTRNKGVEDEEVQEEDARQSILYKDFQKRFIKQEEALTLEQQSCAGVGPAVVSSSPPVSSSMGQNLAKRRAHQVLVKKWDDLFVETAKGKGPQVDELYVVEHPSFSTRGGRGAFDYDSRSTQLVSKKHAVMF